MNNNNIKLSPIIMLVASAAAIVAMIILWAHGVYFFIFLSAANFHFAVVSKKAMGAKGKKSLECREGISANKCKRVLCKIKRKILLSLEQDVQTFSCCNLIRNMLFIEKDACKCRSSTKEIFSKGGAK